MAVNRKYSGRPSVLKRVKALAQSAGHTSQRPKSGDPVLVGLIPGVALTDATADADGTYRCQVQTDGAFDLLVAGIDSSGTSGADANVAVNGGDKVYIDLSKDPPISKRAGGTFFGFVIADDAVEQVASGATTTTALVAPGATPNL